MKYIILLSFFISMNVMAKECVLSAETNSHEKIQTAFQTSSIGDCKELALKTTENNFFGVIDDQTDLVNIKYIFRDETGSTKEEI